MAVNTWDGASDTNWNDAANWNTTGVTDRVPTADDDVVIANVSNNCVMPDGLNPTINSLLVESGGHLTAGNNNITIDSHPASGTNRPIDLSGTFVKGTSTLTFTYSAAETKFLNFRGVEVHNVVINGANTTFAIGNGALTASGNLTITAGTLDTFSAQNNAITVAGITTIGDGTGGTPDEATLTCNGSTCSFGSGVTADYGLKVKANGTFVGGTGTHTAGGFLMDQNQHAKATMTSGVMTIDSEKTSDNKAWRVEYGGDTFDNNNGTVKFAFNGFDSRMSMRSEGHANNAFHNLIIHMFGDTRQISPDNGNKIIVDNDLTITRGKLVMGLSHALEVGGDVVIDDASDTAELEMGSSSNISSQAATFGSLTISNDGTYKATSGTTTITSKAGTNFAFKNTGTFTHNSGTMQIGDGSTSTGGAHLMNTTYHNLIINRDQNAPDGNTPWRPSSGSEVTIAGNLTVTKGRFYRNNSSDSLVVTGDVDIAANGQVGTEAASGSNSFGGIKLATGSKYLATSGTTTITNRFTGESHLWKNDGGTFDHNNGTVKFNDNDHSAVKENTFYNVEVESNLGDYAVSFEAQGGGGNAFTILNNLTITRGDFELANADDTCDIHGQTIINGSSNSAARFNNDKNQTATITHHGLVTIIQGTYHVEDGATVNMAGIRNIGGLVD